MTPIEALDAACEAAGGQVSLASLLSFVGPRVTSQGITDWRRRGVIPADRAEPIETLTGVRAEALCPDVEWIRRPNGRILAYRPPEVRVTPTPRPRFGSAHVKQRLHRHAPRLPRRRA